MSQLCKALQTSHTYTHTLCSNVETPRGKIEWHMENMASISDIKQKVESVYAIPSSEQEVKLVKKISPTEHSYRVFLRTDPEMNKMIALTVVIVDAKTAPDDYKMIPIKVSVSDNVTNVKQIIQTREGIPVKQQRLSHNGSELVDPHLIVSDSNIKTGDELQLRKQENEGSQTQCCVVL
eukprot:303000_1